ncbi:MAG: AAA family ATPase [Pyrinomonadaceae bacterium]|nr:AAA family ATPase [Pyrinomonadaceae bacterium]MBP6213880.1 AAA family ATPase [Pyrinomonadaceae bacterium]
MIELSSTPANFDYSQLFSAKTANQWRSEGRQRPDPKLLFDEFWIEGEMAVLFGDSGKTSLATQIGDSIASGRPIEPMRMTAEAKKVLYLDLALSEKQFEMRYSADRTGEEAETGAEDHQFSDNFIRVQMPSDVSAKGYDGYMAFARGIEWLVTEHEAKVLIIDNITRLRRSTHSTSCEVVLMKELNRLKNTHGLSILVLVNSERRNVMRELTLSDLGPSAILARSADAVFAVGQSEQEGPFRYVKQLRTSSTEIIYSKAHLPTFRLGKIGGNFLGMEFNYYSHEPQEIYAECFADHRDDLLEARKLAEEGRSLREIAETLDISKSRVHRMLQILSQPQPELDPPPVQVRVPQFPGEEKYIEALDSPKYEDIYRREDADAYVLRREAYLIEAAKARAVKMWKEEGIVKTMDEMVEMVKQPWERADAAETPPVANDPETGAEINEIDADLGLMDPETDYADPENMPERLKALHLHRLIYRGDGLTHEIDAYGRNRWVDEYDERGKPQSWYAFDNKDNLYHSEKRPEGRFVTLVDKRNKLVPEIPLD